MFYSVLMISALLTLSLSQTFSGATYSSRLLLSSYASVIVNACVFQNCIGNQAGGAICVTSAASTCLVTQSSFTYCQSSGDVGGAACIYSIQATTSLCAFSYCYCDSNGFALYQNISSSSSANNIIQSSFAMCNQYPASSQSFGTWVMLNGHCLASRLNHSFLSDIFRESAFHYGSGPYQHTQFCHFCNCSGDFVIGIHCVVTSDVQYHECLAFISNEPNYTSVLFFQGNHVISDSVFVGSSKGAAHKDIYYGVYTGQLTMVNCLFDTTYTPESSVITTECLDDQGSSLYIIAMSTCIYPRTTDFTKASLHNAMAPVSISLIYMLLPAF